jgi:hypothetical protein
MIYCHAAPALKMEAVGSRKLYTHGSWGTIIGRASDLHLLHCNYFGQLTDALRARVAFPSPTACKCCGTVVHSMRFQRNCWTVLPWDCRETVAYTDRLTTYCLTHWRYLSAGIRIYGNLYHNNEKPVGYGNRNSTSGRPVRTSTFVTPV